MRRTALVILTGAWLVLGGLGGGGGLDDGGGRSFSSEMGGGGGGDCGDGGDPHFCRDESSVMWASCRPGFRLPAGMTAKSNSGDGGGHGFGGIIGEARAEGMPPLPRGKGESCVEPTAVMRRDHMNFLFRQRDATVRHGIRGGKHSLTGCLECHTRQDAHGEFIAIDANGEFCSVCHRFAAVRIDCFECHAAHPPREAMNTRHPPVNRNRDTASIGGDGG